MKTDDVNDASNALCVALFWMYATPMIAFVLACVVLLWVTS